MLGALLGAQPRRLGALLGAMGYSSIVNSESSSLSEVATLIILR